MEEVEMELNFGQWVVIGICAVLIFGYIRGFNYNRRHAGQVLAWLNEGLKTIGPVSAGGKLPGMATGGRLEVKRGTAPIRRVEAMYILAPRENLFFWLFHRLQGKSDELIVWITYQSKPEHDVEVARPGDRQFENRLKAADKKKLVVQETIRGLQFASEHKKDGVLAGKVHALLEQYGPVVYRLALRDNKPHLFLRVNLRVMKLASAPEFFSSLRDLAK